MLKKIFVGGVIAGLLAGHVVAAVPKTISYKGIALSPAIQDVQLDPSQPSTSFKITVENKLATPVSLRASSLDFKSLNQSGGVAFIGNSASSYKYGLANYLSLPGETINLPAGASRQINVTVNNRADLSPGGHYAAVLFKNLAANGSGTNRIDFNQVVATLVFLRKTGGEIYALNTAPPKIKTAWLGLPNNLDLFMANTGNTQTVPRGVVSITGAGGKQYAKGIVNTDSGLVLPGSTRLYRTAIFKTGHAWLPGRYTANITYRSDDLSSAQTITTSFIYVNLLSVILLIVFIVVLVIIWWFLKPRIKHIKLSTGRR